MSWTKERIQNLVKQLVPDVKDVEVKFLRDGIRVTVTAESVRGVQPRVHNVLSQTLPPVIKTLQVLVRRG